MNYTKSQMLLYLKKNIEFINILPILVVKSDDIKNKLEEVIDEIVDFSNDKPIIVRSSSSQEDSLEFSNAGKFESILNVKPNYSEIKKALINVYESYMTQKNEEILVQPMLQDIKKSGVVFTADMDTFADYYTVNYFEGDNSAAVTGGGVDDLKTFIFYKHSNLEVVDSDIENLFNICKEIEKKLNNGALDIEFAITDEGKVYIFQVRPIASGKKEMTKKYDLGMPLQRIYKKIKKLSQSHPFLLGNTTYFGVMPDWNPAEILGVRPKKLSISLYKELITDNVWAHQRYDYGYRDLTMHPLMVSFCGIPYIDTRITFNSFIPQNLNKVISEKLVNFYLCKLKKSPKYHDKIEFEIVYSCYYFGLSKKLEELKNYGFNENELKRIEFALLELTNKIIDPKEGLYKKDILKAEILEKNYNKIIESDISKIDKIYWLIEECKAYGTLPFAGVARAAFIAVQFLRSFVDSGIIDKDTHDNYLNSLYTINKKMNLDLKKYYDAKLSRKEFLDKYGHIRPGTYDIMSKRYDEAFDEYFGNNLCLEINNTCLINEFSKEIMDKIQIELEQNGLLVSAAELMQFIKEAIEGREYLKFIFTKLVSKILQLIEELGNRVGIKKEDMSYLDISVIKQLYVDLYTGNIRDMFLENIKNNKLQHDNALQIKLPSIIVNPEDVYGFYLLNEEPNFITQKNITANIVKMDDKNIDCRGKIVFIQSADPGYDFLFSKNISGLVTQFGGVNSHMAIRCAELGIPAVIGVGENNYKEWSSYKIITIDCLKKQVIKIT